MKTCICCNKRSYEIMGPKCGSLSCKCKGVLCPHCNTRVKLLEVGTGIYVEHVVFCSGCGCSFPAHPKESAFQVSFLCKYAQKDAALV